MKPSTPSAAIMTHDRLGPWSHVRAVEHKARHEKSVLDLVKANKPLVVMLAQVGSGLVAAGTAVVTLGTVIWGFRPDDRGGIGHVGTLWH